MKRMTETSKWADPWFRALSPENKCLWQWLLDNCDCAGIIEMDMGLASFQVGATKPLDSPLVALSGRVTQINGKLFIPKFIQFQYGTELHAKNSAHRGVLKRLEITGIPSPVDVVGLDGRRTKGVIPQVSPYEAPSKPLGSPYEAPQDKDKDKGTDKVQGTSEDHANLELLETPSPLKRGESDELPFDDVGEKPQAIAANGKKRKPRESKPPIELPFHSTEFIDALTAFKQHRKEKGSPWTPTAERQSMQKFAKWGEAKAIAALRHSTEQGWTGVFEESASQRKGFTPAHHTEIMGMKRSELIDDMEKRLGIPIT